MNLALFYGLVLIAAGAFSFILVSTVSRLDRRLRHWPALWAWGLVVSVAVPVMGWCLPDISDQMGEIGAGYGALDLHSDALLRLPKKIGVAASAPDWRGNALFAEFAVAIYFLGVALGLLRLLLGRFRAARIAANAVRRTSISGATYWESGQATSPFAISSLSGKGASRIVIPADFVLALSDDDLELVIRHERAHIDRFDDQVGFALMALLAVSWISPFSHFLFARWSLSTEVQCDQAALAGRSTRMRNAYAAMLLNALHIMAGRVRQYPAPSFSTQRLRNEKMRIAQIMNRRPISFKRAMPQAVLSAAAIGVVAVGGASVAAIAQADSKPIDVARVATAESGKVVAGQVSARFGKVADPFRSGEMRQHWGIDIKAPIGTPIHAPADGTIEQATNLYDGKPAYGIVVLHRSADGTLTLFAHLDGFVVTPGQRVAKGQKIAMVGNTGQSTGPHVHIETIRGGKRIDPLAAWPDLM